jgi:hypothetical protein
VDLEGRQCQEAEEECIMNSFTNCTLPEILLGQASHGDEMGGACSTGGKHEKRILLFGRRPEGKRPLDRPRVDGRIIL